MHVINRIRSKNSYRTSRRIMKGYNILSFTVMKVLMTSEKLLSTNSVKSIA